MPFAFDSTLGTLFIGYIMSTFLLGISACQLYIYFVKFPKDKIWMKILVWSVWIAEPIHFIGLTQFLYHVFVKGFGNILKLLEIPAGFHVATMMSAYIAVATQGFMIYRIWKLGQNHFLVAGLSLVSLTALALHLAVNIEGILKAKRFASHFTASATLIQSNKYRWLPLAETSIAAGSDVLLTLSLWWILRDRIRRAPGCSSAKVVEKLILWTMETGLLTSVLHITVAICYAAKPSNYMWLGLWFCTSRCYSNSLLAILNGRASLRGMIHKIDVCPLPPSLGHGDSQSSDGPGVIRISEREKTADTLGV